MKTSALFLISLFAVLNSFAVSQEEYDFKFAPIRWGMNVEGVKPVVKGTLLDEQKDLLRYSEGTSGPEITFLFNQSGKLYRVQNDMTPSATSDLERMALFDVIKLAMLEDMTDCKIQAKNEAVLADIRSGRENKTILCVSKSRRGRTETRLFGDGFKAHIVMTSDSLVQE